MSEHREKEDDSTCRGQCAFFQYESCDDQNENKPEAGIADEPDFTALKPMAFMNRSGPVVRFVMDRLGAAPENLLVVCDDFNLTLGKIRLRKSGSAGGHNGLKSVIESLDSSGFPRLRLGIGGAD